MADEKDPLPDPVEDEESDIPECPRCGNPHDPGDIVCVMCGMNLATGPDPQAESSSIRQATRNMLILLALMAAGMALRWGCSSW